MIIETITAGLPYVIGVLIIISILFAAAFASRFVIAKIVPMAYDYNWSLGTIVSILLLILYVLIASFIVGIFLI